VENSLLIIIPVTLSVITFILLEIYIFITGKDIFGKIYDGNDFVAANFVFLMASILIGLFSYCIIYSFITFSHIVKNVLFILLVILLAIAIKYSLWRAFKRKHNI